MILKIKREIGGQDWWILDDIRKISVSRLKKIECTDINELNDFCNELGHDIFLLDEMNMVIGKQVGKSEGSPESFPYKELIYRTSKGDEFSAIFDTVAYLCNDEGKTIEKISVD